MKKNVIVTGGVLGIGKAIVDRLKRNYHIIVIDKLLGDNQEVDFFQCDLMDINAIKETINQILLKYDHIHALINNAAMQIVEPFESVSIDHWDQTFFVNLRAPFFVSQWISQKMNHGDIIINISSVHGEKPRLSKMPYDISKAGMNLFTKELALALSPKGIRVNSVSCGATMTPLNDNFVDSNILNKTENKIPLGRVAQPEEIASLVCWLMTEEASYITGSIFTIDGGRSLIG